MIPVSDALSACLDLCAPLETEEVPLAEAATRTLARAVTARRDQPPFASSAMDGYAVTEDDLIPGRSLRVVGEAAAGHHWAGRIGRGEAVRIFTGAPVPDGAAAVVIQEDVTRDGQRITLGRQLDDNRNIRAAGGDFRAGDSLSAQSDSVHVRDCSCRICNSVAQCVDIICDNKPTIQHIIYWHRPR